MSPGRMSCPICWTSAAYPGMKHDGALWLRCPACGLLFDPRGDVAMKEWLEVKRRNGGVIPEGTEPAKWPDDEQAWRNVLGSVLERLPPTCAAKTLLEVGCGPGTLLAWAEFFEKRVGTDLSPGNIMACRARGLDARYLDICTEDVPEMVGASDVIIANQVMEHLVEPHQFMRGVARHLSPTGIFWATFCIEHPHELVKAGETFWWTMRAAAILIERAGLEVFDVRWSHFSLNIMARRLVRCEASVARKAAATHEG